MNRFVVAETAVIDAPLGLVWDVISRTDRYAEWVAGAIEVTDHHGVARGALATGDVRRHQRLAVAGQQRVRCAQHERQGDRQQTDTPREVAPPDQVVEAIVDVSCETARPTL